MEAIGNSSLGTFKVLVERDRAYGGDDENGEERFDHVWSFFRVGLSTQHGQWSAILRARALLIRSIPITLSGILNFGLAKVARGGMIAMEART